MSIILNSERLIIRDFKPDDYNFFCKQESAESTLRYESDIIPTTEVLNEKFNEIMNLTLNDNRSKYSLLVETRDGNVPLGRVVIWQIDEKIAEWEMGWTIHLGQTKKGYASEAAGALIQFGFEQLNANRICANCNEANIASERVMQKIGMKKEGVLRQTRKLNDEWYGSCIYSILRSEFCQLKSKNFGGRISFGI